MRTHTDLCQRAAAVLEVEPERFCQGECETEDGEEIDDPPAPRMPYTVCGHNVVICHYFAVCTECNPGYWRKLGITNNADASQYLRQRYLQRMQKKKAATHA